MLSPSPGLKVREPGAPMPKGKRRWMSQLKTENKLALPLTFCSGLNWLGDAYLQWWLQSSSLSLWIKMLISSGNTLTDTPRHVLPAFWASLNSVKLTHKTNHYSTLWATYFNIIKEYFQFQLQHVKNLEIITHHYDVKKMKRQKIIGFWGGPSENWGYTANLHPKIWKDRQTHRLEAEIYLTENQNLLEP